MSKKLVPSIVLVLVVVGAIFVVPNMLRSYPPGTSVIGIGVVLFMVVVLVREIAR